ncbi:MAG: SHOCT domain-containing protein [Acidimicrobiia bacterium]
MFLAEWQVGQAVWTILWFTLFFIWIWLFILVVMDIFRSPDLGGVAKTLWLIFVIFFTYIGIFVYLIARGGKMHEHAVQAAKAQDDAFKAYVQQAAGSGDSPADQLAKLHDLKEKGAISDAEYNDLKAKVVGA